MVRTVQIAIVDDDLDMREAIEAYLADEGFTITGFRSGEELLQHLATSTPDLVIIDGKLPGIDGFKLTQRIRIIYDVGIIIVTARQDINDRVIGLEMGADDYVTKPFANRELLIRVRTVLKNRGLVLEKDPNDSAGSGENYWKLNRAKRELTSPTGKKVPLTAAEFELLLIFTSSLDVALTRNEIMTRWKKKQITGTETVIDVHLARIRKKFHALGEDFFIKTVRSQGFVCSTVVQNV